MAIFPTSIARDVHISWPNLLTAAATPQPAGQAQSASQGTAAGQGPNCRAVISIGTKGYVRLVPTDGPTAAALRLTGCPPLLLRAANTTAVVGHIEQAAQARSPWTAAMAQLTTTPAGVTACLVSSRIYTWLLAVAPGTMPHVAMVLGYALLPIANVMFAFDALFTVFQVRHDLRCVRRAQALYERLEQQGTLSKKDVKTALSLGAYNLRNRNPLSEPADSLKMILGRDLYLYALGRAPELTEQRYRHLCNMQDLDDSMQAFFAIVSVMKSKA